MSLTPEQIQYYKTNGYLVLRDFFSDEEVARFKAGCKKRPVGDTAGIPDFNYSTISPKVISVMKSLLGDRVLYPGLSFTRTEDVPKMGLRKFHSDAASDDFNFSKDYPIINTGVYLQDQTRWSGALKLIPASHTRPCDVITSGVEGVKKVIRYLLKGEVKKALRVFDFHRSIFVDSMPRDLIIWSTRLHHSGYGVRLKWFPNLSLHPVIENWLPSFLCVPNNPERDVILTIYAAPSEYFEEYLKIQIRKAHRKEHFLASRLGDPDVLAKAKESGVELRNDGYHYAKDPQSTFSIRTEEMVASGGI